MEDSEPLHVVVDSSALVALMSETDVHHRVALAESKRLADLDAIVVTPADVFTETVNVLGKRFGHVVAIEAAKLVLESGLFLIEETNEELRQAALKLFEAQGESVSFTDCVVMAEADLLETRNVFGFDEAFEKNDYEIPTGGELEDAASRSTS